MKLLLGLLLPFIFMTEKAAVKKDKTVYYFCVSRSTIPLKDNKLNIVYSGITSCVSSQTVIWNKVADWKQQVSKVLNQEPGCTADLNYYPTYEEAKLQFDLTEKRYADSKKFITRKIDFK